MGVTDTFVVFWALPVQVVIIALSPSGLLSTQLLYKFLIGAWGMGIQNEPAFPLVDGLS